MTRNADNQKTLIDSSASKLAFRLGQLVERRLIERATELAGRDCQRIVTSDHVHRAIDDELIHELTVQFLRHEDVESGSKRKIPA